MSNTAIILSGQMRTFARCYPSQKWAVYRKFDNPHFFVSCADDEQAESAELLKKDWANVHIEKVTPPELTLPDKSFTEHAPYSITPTKTPGVSPLQGIMRQLWHLSRAWKFTNERTGDLEAFDTVIRCRPDLHFHKFKFDVPVYEDDAYTPWWGTYGGVNDRFAVLGVKAAKAYFETYENVPALLAAGCSFHPESLVAASLEKGGFHIEDNLTAEFGMFRLNGELQHMEIIPGEIARYSATYAK
jgi:hypothetical protein